MDSQDKKLLQFIQKIKDEKKRISQLVENNKLKYNQQFKKK